MTAMITIEQAADILRRAFGSDKGMIFLLDAVHMGLTWKREGIKYVLEGVPDEPEFYYLTSSFAADNKQLREV